MTKDTDKTKEQLLFELSELRKKSKEQKNKLMAANQQLDASNQQLISSEKSLQESVEKFSKAFNLHPSSMAIIDIDTLERIAVNDYFVELVGYSREKLMANPLGALGELDPDKIQVAVKAVKKGISLRDVEVMLTDSEGSKRVMSYAVEGIKIGERNCMIVSGSDITERKRAEEELKAANLQLNAHNQQLQATEQQLRAGNQQLIASEAKFRSYIQNAPDGIFIANEKGKYIEVNKAACEITGYSEDELLKLTIPELIQEGYSEKAKNHFQTLVKEGFANGELGFVTKSGEKRFWSVDAVKLSETRFLGFAKDITNRKHMEEVLEKRMVALIQPLESSADIAFDELFNLADIQKLQDQFAEATGVASIITHTDGTPITNPSNFCRLCNDIIRKTDKGLKNCLKSDAKLGKYNPKGATVQPCLSGGLWDAGAAITVGGKHIANWLIGQVRDETQSDESMKAYAEEIGVDEASFINAFREVPAMPIEQFEKVAQTLYTLANQLSTIAYQNIQQARFINERKQAEEQLKESERNFSKIFNSSRDGYVICLGTGEFLSPNPAYVKMLGYTMDEIFNVSWKNITPEKWLGWEMETQGAKLVERGYSDLYEKEYIRKDGTTFPVQIQAFLLNKPEKLEDALMGVFARDITEQKTAEILIEKKNQELFKAKEKAEESEAYSTMLVGSTPIGLALTKISGELVEVNEAYSNIIGYSIEDTLKLSYWDITPEKYAQQEQEQLDSLNTTGSNGPYEKEYIHKSGELIPVRLQGKIIEKEGCKYIWSSVEDISDIKKAEQELKESEERFKALHNASFGGIAIHDKGVILECNLGLSQISGFSRDELIGAEGIALLIAPESHESVINRIRSGDEKSYEVFGQRKNGEKYPVRLEARQIPYKGKHVRVVEFRDITERKLAEQQLIESEARYSFIANNTADSIWVMDKNLRFTYLSPSTVNLFGYSIEEWDTLDWNEFVHPNYMETVLDSFDKLKSEKDKTMTPVSVIVSHKNGTEMWVEFSANAIFDENNEFSSAVGVTRDITERKQAEEIEESRRAILKTAMDGFWIVDMKGRFIEVNETYCMMSGYTKNELLKMGVSDIEDIETYDATAAHIQKVIAEGQDRFESRHRRKDGSVFDVEVSVQYRQSDEPKLVVFIHDITERKHAEGKLKRSEEELKKAQAITHIGSWYLDVETNEVTWTEELFKMYGFDPTKPVPPYTEHMKLFTAESWELLSTSLENTKQTGIPYELELRTVRKDKSNGWIWARGEAMQEDGKTIGLWGAAQDISERKQLELDLLNAKEKAEESDHLKSAFLANMSHEIRTPMNGILGFTELLKEPQLSGDKKEKYIQVIEKSGNRMLNTINDIIDISIIEAGQVKVLNSEVSVNSILDEQYNFFLREAESKGLKFNYQPSLTDSESRIFTDPHKLEGILTNLLKNAVKYTETGEITMGCCFKDKADNTFIEFYVKDTGIGIPANRVDAVFNRFEQADIADTQVYEGSGLGLAISKSYVEMLGGEISAKSKENEGSTFTFSIPYNKISAKENSLKKNNEEESRVSLNNLSVIVAEDDEVSWMFLDTILINHVKSITYTTTGKETIEKFRENLDTDIILMDIKMPDMNGYDATREIRKYNRDVIIIAQTAYGLTSDKEKALEAGCDDYISKPIKKEILFEKIRMCLDKKSI